MKGKHIMTTRESAEDEQMREIARNLFTPDPDDMPTGNWQPLERASVETVRPDNPDTAEREFIRALFDSNPDEN